MKERTTIHDIAKSLSVTASTVSRALQDHPRISAKTKRAVMKAAALLNYQPNHIAAALRKGRSNIIGIIVPTIDRTFFSSMVRGIEEIANDARYNVMICQSYDSESKEAATVEALLNARVDGIIASFAKETKDFSHFSKVKERGIPLIFFDRTNDDLGISHVVIDDYYGAYKATEHLIQQGCRRIAHFTSKSKISIYRERFRGYVDALAKYSLKPHEGFVIESNLQLEDGRSSMTRLLELDERPDAVFSASDLGIMGALQICKARNISVPQEVALVGFSNEPYTSFSQPGITTVDQHSKRMGNAAAKIFLEKIEAPGDTEVVEKIVLKPELIIRGSSLRQNKA